MKQQREQNSVSICVGERCQNDRCFRRPLAMPDFLRIFLAVSGYGLTMSLMALVLLPPSTLQFISAAILEVHLGVLLFYGVLLQVWRPAPAPGKQVCYTNSKKINQF